jgi:hypothetical protein
MTAMSEDQTTQSHVIDRIEAYLADGLSPEERPEFESHLAECDLCSEAVAAARRVDEELGGLFRVARPDAAFEDRLVRTLRTRRQRQGPFLHPMILRSAAAVAAAVAITGTGIVVNNVMTRNGHDGTALFSAETNRRLQSDFLQTGTSFRVESNGDSVDHETLGNAYFARSRNVTSSVEGKPSQSAEGLKSGIQRFGALRGDVVVADASGSTHNGQFGGGSGGGARGFRAQLGREATDSFDAITPPTNGPTPAASTPSSNQNHNVYYSFQPAKELKELPAPATLMDGTQAATGRSLGAEGVTDNTGLSIPAPAQGVPESGKPPAANWALAYGEAQVTNGAAYRGPVSAPPIDGQPAKAPDTATPTPPTPANPTTTNPSGSRKVIRNGTLEFEVERFDDSVVRITKLVDEQGGFVATTDSDKLPNGHVKGTITLRVPPEHLDTLVLTLRGMGDLKSQKISAEDVTKHYTDLESELRAARAMEERLLEIIKTANGQIKDLLAAEKELGIWREKIEAIEGEKRYLDNQVSLSTLVVSLYEKDIRTPASATESEQVQMSLETEKVDDAYNKALEAIKTAKGRITQSELKQFDAGQFGATIVAAVPPDAAEQVIARLRQLDGRIAHFSRDRHQTTQTGVPVPAAVMQIQRDDTVLNLQIYNLANIAPRRTTTVSVAAAQVDRTYAQLVEQVRSAGGRIVTSSLAKPDANTQTADVDFQVPTEKADAMLDLIRGYGEVMQQDLSENPDTANVTEAKRGFHLRLISLAAVPARETQTLQLAAGNVPQAFNDILSAAKAADARVFQSDLSEQNPQDITAAITIEVPRTASGSVDAAIAKAAQVLTRTVNRSAELDKTVDTKLRLTLAVISADRLPPRQTTTERIEVQDVERASDDLVNAAVEAGGRRLGNGEMSQDRAGHVTSQVVVEVPMSKAGSILDLLERSGSRRSKQVSFDSTIPEGPLARARIDATFSNSAASLGGEETTWDAIRNGLSVSGRGLRWSLQMLVVGFCFVAPWIFVLWLIWKLIRRGRSRPVAVPAPS